MKYMYVDIMYEYTCTYTDKKYFGCKLLRINFIITDNVTLYYTSRSIIPVIFIQNIFFPAQSPELKHITFYVYKL